MCILNTNGIADTPRRLCRLSSSSPTEFLNLGREDIARMKMYHGHWAGASLSRSWGTSFPFRSQRSAAVANRRQPPSLRVDALRPHGFACDPVPVQRLGGRAGQGSGRIRMQPQRGTEGWLLCDAKARRHVASNRSRCHESHCRGRLQGPEKQGAHRCLSPRFTRLLDAVQQYASIGDVLIGGSQNLMACGVWPLVRTSLLVGIGISRPGRGS